MLLRREGYRVVVLYHKKMHSTHTYSNGQIKETDATHTHQSNVTYFVEIDSSPGSSKPGKEEGRSQELPICLDGEVSVCFWTN